MKPIQFKRSCISGVKPTSCELEEGEIALNLADKVAYSKDCDGKVVEIAGGIPDEINGGKYTGKCDPTVATVCLSSEITLPATSGAGWGVPIYKNTGKYFNAGDLITVAARGCTSCVPGSCLSGPDGFDSNRSPETNWMRLTGVLDSRNSVQLTGTEVTDSFTVGSSYSQPAATSGYLYLGIYDGDYTDNFGNYCAAVSGGSDIVAGPVAAASTVTLTQQPQNVTAANGVAVMSVAATASSGTLTYGWQWYNDGVGWVPVADGAGGVWSSATGSSSNTLSVTGLRSVAQFRAVVATSTAVPVVSAISTVTPQAASNPYVSTITISSQPTSSSPSSGVVNVSVVATATYGTLAYQWQSYNSGWVSVVNGSGAGWSSASGATTSTLSITGLTSATQFRCVVSTVGNTAAPVSSSAITVSAAVTPTSTVTITSSPSGAFASGGVGSLTVAATASAGTLTYQWQLHLTDGSWIVVSNSSTQFYTSASGWNTATLTITGLKSSAEFRCVVATSTATPVVSNSAFVS